MQKSERKGKEFIFNALSFTYLCLFRRVKDKLFTVFIEQGFARMFEANLERPGVSIKFEEGSWFE